MAKHSETRSESMKKRCADPEYRVRMSEARRKQWESPGYRARMSLVFAKRGRSRIGKDAPVFTHGMCGTPEYVAYHSAKQRCMNPNNPKYCDYGGRGISFLYESFEQFLAEVGPRPSKEHSLDRLKNDLGYQPGNCAWRSAKEQVQNRRVFMALQRYTDEQLTFEVRRRGLVVTLS